MTPAGPSLFLFPRYLPGAADATAGKQRTKYVLRHRGSLSPSASSFRSDMTFDAATANRTASLNASSLSDFSEDDSISSEDLSDNYSSSSSSCTASDAEYASGPTGGYSSGSTRGRSRAATRGPDSCVRRRGSLGGDGAADYGSKGARELVGKSPLARAAAVAVRGSILEQREQQQQRRQQPQQQWLNTLKNSVSEEDAQCGRGAPTDGSAAVQRGAKVTLESGDGETKEGDEWSGREGGGRDPSSSTRSRRSRMFFPNFRESSTHPFSSNSVDSLSQKGSPVSWASDIFVGDVGGAAGAGVTRIGDDYVVDISPFGSDRKRCVLFISSGCRECIGMLIHPAPFPLFRLYILNCRTLTPPQDGNQGKTGAKTESRRGMVLGDTREIGRRDKGGNISARRGQS